MGNFGVAKKRFEGHLIEGQVRAISCRFNSSHPHQIRSIAAPWPNQVRLSKGLFPHSVRLHLIILLDSFVMIFPIDKGAEMARYQTGKRWFINIMLQHGCMMNIEINKVSYRFDCGLSAPCKGLAHHSHRMLYLSRSQNAIWD